MPRKSKLLALALAALTTVAMVPAAVAAGSVVFINHNNITYQYNCPNTCIVLYRGDGTHQVTDSENEPVRLTVWYADGVILF